MANILTYTYEQCISCANFGYLHMACHFISALLRELSATFLITVARKTRNHFITTLQ